MHTSNEIAAFRNRLRAHSERILEGAAPAAARHGLVAPPPATPILRMGAFDKVAIGLRIRANRLARQSAAGRANSRPANPTTTSECAPTPSTLPAPVAALRILLPPPAASLPTPTRLLQPTLTMSKSAAHARAEETARKKAEEAARLAAEAAALREADLATRAADAWRCAALRSAVTGLCGQAACARQQRTLHLELTAVVGRAAVRGAFAALRRAACEQRQRMFTRQLAALLCWRRHIAEAPARPALAPLSVAHGAVNVPARREAPHKQRCSKGPQTPSQPPASLNAAAASSPPTTRSSMAQALAPPSPLGAFKHCPPARRRSSLGPSRV